MLKGSQAPISSTMNNKNYQNLDSFSLSQKFIGKHKLILLFWSFVQCTLFALSPQFMYGWRRFLLRIFGARLGKNVVIRPSVKIIYPWKLNIGDYSWIGDDVTLYAIGKINIGSNTVISQKSYLCAGGHDYKSPTFDTFAKDINIGNKVWITTDVFIAPGITVGDGAIVGARSSVFEDLPENMVCIGNPAKAVKSRFE